jgi:hypothetical protein
MSDFGSRESINWRHLGGIQGSAWPGGKGGWDWDWDWEGTQHTGTMYHAAKQNTKHESNEVKDGGQGLWTLCLWLCAVSPETESLCQEKMSSIPKESSLRGEVGRSCGVVVLRCCARTSCRWIFAQFNLWYRDPEKPCPTHPKRRRTLPNLS